jgi:hypothetical protein
MFAAFLVKVQRRLLMFFFLFVDASRNFLFLFLFFHFLERMNKTK